jgi:chromosome segregation ATPase
LVEAVMLVVLGFLCASLCAVAMVPALARRADRLARRRAEAMFPLSLAEIAADRDHLRAEHAVRVRQVEQQAAAAKAARAEALKQLGQRDVDLARRSETIAAHEQRIVRLEADLAATKAVLDETRARLEAETAAAAATREERDAGHAEIAARDGQIEALRAVQDEMRVQQVETRTLLMNAEGERDALNGRLAALQREHDRLSAAFKAMTVDRDSERLRADALAARAEQAESGLAAADAAATVAAAEIRRLEGELQRAGEAARREAEQVSRLGEELDRSRGALAAETTRASAEKAAMQDEVRIREAKIEALHAELQTLAGALAQARFERDKRRDGAAQPASDQAALRQEIVRLADTLMQLSPKRAAAE